MGGDVQREQPSSPIGFGGSVQQSSHHMRRQPLAATGRAEPSPALGAQQSTEGRVCQ